MRGHIADSSPPCPLRYVPCIFIARGTHSALSCLVDSNRMVVPTHDYIILMYTTIMALSTAAGRVVGVIFWEINNPSYGTYVLYGKFFDVFVLLLRIYTWYVYPYFYECSSHDIVYTRTSILQQYRTPINNTKQESWSRLGFLFLFQNGCFLHKVQYNNDSQISYFPVNICVFFLLLVFLLYRL